MPRMPPTFKPPGLATDKDRGTPEQRGYDSRWRKRSTAYRRSNPLCVGCKAVGRVQEAECTDHIEPHCGDETLLWDPNNLQALCRACHNLKQTLEHMWRRGEIGREDLRMDSEAAKKLQPP